MRKRLIYAAGAVFLSGCAPPLCPDGMQIGEQGRVVRIIDGDALVLNSGQSVRLAAIEAPTLANRDRPGQTYADESRRYLEDRALGRDVQLCYPGLTRDRYDRALAHVFTQGGRGRPYWLNYEVVNAGMARVRFYPDTLSDAAPLLAAEDAAIEAGKGLWGKPDYHVQDAVQLDADMAGFMLIKLKLGPLQPVAQTPYRRRTACRRSSLNAALIIDIEQPAADLCQATAGENYVLRGWVSNNRLRLTLAAHAQLIDVPK